MGLEIHGEFLLPLSCRLVNRDFSYICFNLSLKFIELYLVAYSLNANTEFLF